MSDGEFKKRIVKLSHSPRLTKCLHHINKDELEKMIDEAKKDFPWGHAQRSENVMAWAERWLGQQDHEKKT
jgi:hypothetical protein